MCGIVGGLISATFTVLILLNNIAQLPSTTVYHLLYTAFEIQMTYNLWDKLYHRLTKAHKKGPLTNKCHKYLETAYIAM